MSANRVFIAACAVVIGLFGPSTSEAQFTLQDPSLTGGVDLTVDLFTGTSISGNLPQNLPSTTVNTSIASATGLAGISGAADSGLLQFMAGSTISFTPNDPFGGTDASLGLGGSIGGYSLTTPPPNTDFYYFFGPVLTSVTGTLAPGASATVRIEVQSAAELYFFLKSFNNNTSTAETINETSYTPQIFLGDWFSERDNPNLGPGLSVTVLTDLSAIAGATGTSTINVDPTFGVIGTDTLAVPEPSTLLLSSIAVILALALPWWRRRRAFAPV